MSLKDLRSQLLLKINEFETVHFGAIMPRNENELQLMLLEAYCAGWRSMRNQILEVLKE